jgi:bla regulator protein blaR1
MRSRIALAMLAGSILTPLLAQQPDGPRFAVVSVKPYNSLEPGGRNALVPGAYEGIGVTVRRVIGLAYAPLPASVIDGGPGWLSTDRFEIHAKFEGNPPREQVQQMLRALLADRFKLRTHMEMRPTRVFALTVEKPGTLGPALRPAETDCANRPPDRGPGCGGFQYTDGLLRGRDATLDRIAGELPVERIVLNRTGLSGRYDVDLRWAPDPNAASAPDAPPGLVTAVREQLGLRLQPDTAPMDHLVIDSVDRPTPD